MRRKAAPQPPPVPVPSRPSTPETTDYDAALTKLKQAHAAVDDAIELLADDTSMTEHLTTLDSVLSRIKVAIRKKL